jgi:hypothetical protein
MGFSTEENHVRIDIFKPGGKWMDTEVIVFRSWGEKYGSVQECTELATDQALKGRYNGMRIVCLEPYHENAHPVSFIYQEVLCPPRKLLGECP